MATTLRIKMAQADKNTDNNQEGSRIAAATQSARQTELATIVQY